ncbi:MAG: ribosomal protein S5 domain 2-type protein, partial [Olpidium bornovanus]
FPRNRFSPGSDSLTTATSRAVPPPPPRLEHSARLNAIRKLFLEKYGREPDFFARSPGRVNLIGEHIDYCGFSVFPMAVDKDIIIAVGIDCNSRRVRVANVDEKYAPVEFELSSAADGYCTINAAVHEWSNYFKCGVRGILEHIRPDAPRGMVWEDPQPDKGRAI